ncbi:hypothetical protein DITRI_Ditri17bG0109000 [Diplodiscus trichospermus]
MQSPLSWRGERKRRQNQDFLYLGMGVSGGEEGARHRLSLMPGGSYEVYKYREDILLKVAAQDPRIKDDIGLDKTGLKVTSKWTVQQSAELSVTAPTIASSLDECYAQGMKLIRAKSIKKGWDLKLEDLARIWKGGISTPGMSSSLAYVDPYQMKRLPAILVHAQRDYFGVHAKESLMSLESFHTEWFKIARHPKIQFGAHTYERLMSWDPSILNGSRLPEPKIQWFSALEW